uniref:Uncharacterized protein n=1 Tax=viral metagenome TaxID=1070528 RepID=A0A6C0D8D4_9ZZZZ
MKFIQKGGATYVNTILILIYLLFAALIISLIVATV